MVKQNKKLKFYLFIALFAILFVILYVLSSLSGLRFFIPHYFDIAGGPFSEKNYLVVFQNNNELRPSGGFISSYGVLHFKNGLFNNIDIKDVFGEIANHKYIDPPYPQKNLLDGKFYQGYTFRDANYYADFPETVTELMKMYRLTDNKTQLDGIIAVNLNVMEDLLNILKYIRVGDLQFTSENIFELLEFSLNNIDYHNIQEIAQRKNILAPLAKALIKKTIFSPFKWRQISDMVVENLNKKNIQLYFFNQSLQEKINQKKWGGAWPKTNDDFLAVVEANLAGMKSDRYIKRNIKYRLQIWEEKGRYTLTGTTIVEMEHFGDYNVPISGNYQGYLRIYLPKGANLIKSNVDTHNDSTSKHAVFGTIVKLKPGEHKRIEFKYSLPSSIFNGKTYNLNLVKQSGTTDDNYSVIIEAPQGTEIVKGSKFEGRENYAIWEGKLLKNISLKFNLLPDKLGPRIAYSKIDSLNKILVVFNERITPEILENLSNFTIEDTDKANIKIHDNIKIKNVHIDFKDLWIEIEGMTKQPKEFYKLTIKNAEDLYGNSMQPLPKSVTLVQ